VELDAGEHLRQRADDLLALLRQADDQLPVRVR
jgi:hypothetical protein